MIGTIKSVDCKTGIVSETEMEVEERISEPTPIEKTLEEKYDELRALFLEYLEVQNG
jgi:hypothetical protein